MCYLIFYILSSLISEVYAFRSERNRHEKCFYWFVWKFHPFCFEKLLLPVQKFQNFCKLHKSSLLTCSKKFVLTYSCSVTISTEKNIASVRHKWQVFVSVFEIDKNHIFKNRYQHWLEEGFDFKYIFWLDGTSKTKFCRSIAIRRKAFFGKNDLF